MSISWIDSAILDLDQRIDHLAETNPPAAARMAAQIDAEIHRLLDHPHVGRPGQIPGTRELVVKNTPLIIVYSIEADNIVILRVRHGAPTLADLPLKSGKSEAQSPVFCAEHILDHHIGHERLARYTRQTPPDPIDRLNNVPQIIRQPAHGIGTTAAKSNRAGTERSVTTSTSTPKISINSALIDPRSSKLIPGSGSTSRSRSFPSRSVPSATEPNTSGFPARCRAAT